MYYVATPVCIAENEGVFGSMSRSAQLTKGHRWQIFGILVLIWIASVIITVLIEALGVGLGAIPGFILTQVWQVVAGAFGGGEHQSLPDARAHGGRSHRVVGEPARRRVRG